MMQKEGFLVDEGLALKDVDFAAQDGDDEETKEGAAGNADEEVEGELAY